MNATKKFDRLRQWGREKMGADSKTTSSEVFKCLEQEMNTRHEGMEKLHDAMSQYVKHLSEKKDGDGKEKATPVSTLASTMSRHGQELDAGSIFGQSLIRFGESHERVARIQESYAMKAKTSWLDACAKSLVMLKDYQNARKKLESRRLAYDTLLTKMHKAKKEDFKVEDDIRAQKAKYEESVEEVTRRMEDIVAADGENLVELQALLDAEILYHEKSRDVLLQLKTGLLNEIDAQACSVQAAHSRASSTRRFRSDSSDEENVPFSSPPTRVTATTSPSSLVSSRQLPNRRQTSPGQAGAGGLGSHQIGFDSTSDESTDDEPLIPRRTTAPVEPIRILKKAPPPPPPSRNTKPSFVRNNIANTNLVSAV